ncbi:MAG: HAMP domain-containing protein [Sulfuricella sp.]|nr:HAMP domain-containing protein [Sulfuricella sp.]
MTFFENLPIKRKLMLIGLVTNGVAVVIISIALGISVWSSYRSRAVTSLSIHAGVIADNAAPALLFSDEQAANEVLGRLRTEPTVVYASLRDGSGGQVAAFEAPKRHKTPPHLPSPDDPLFFEDQLVYAKNVVHERKVIGTLYLQSDLRDIQWELLRQLSIIASAMAVSLSLALFLFARFQKAISTPISDLAEAIRRVTEERDYSVRVTARSTNEFGTLASGFNTMLTAIRDREAALAIHQAGLEETVRQRTAELKTLNETLEQRVQEELAKNREKDHLMIRQSRLAAIGEMIGNIAHQWRQPINALTLLLANIKDAYDFNELDEAYLYRSVETGQTIIQRMSTTIDDFRNFFRPNKEKAHFSVNEALEDALRIMEAAFRSNDIKVVLEGEPGVTAYGFRNEYSQVLLNLLTNAKEAIQSRKMMPGTVRIAVHMRAGQSEVSVEDNAGGIPPDILPKIFDPYFTTKEKGTGIGLYMSKMIIENSMDGVIEVGNSPTGARFSIVTPA